MIRTVTLLAATLTTGIMAGLFYSFSVAVMPGLRNTDDRTFVDAMQRINVSILNGWFALCFGGALLFTAAALATHLGRRAVMLPILAALILYVIVLGITFVVNVPLNNQLLAAGVPAELTDPLAVRAAFETSWVRWNHLRTIINTAAFGCLCWALLQQSA